MYGIRFVKTNGSIYLRQEDVASYLRELAGAEETDTRSRLEEAARLIERDAHFTPKPLSEAKGS